MALATVITTPSVSVDDILPVVCFHCGDGIPVGTHFHVVTPSGPEPVCCAGCRAVAETILGNGLADYYRYRESTANRADIAKALVPEQYAIYDDPALQSSFVLRLDDTTLQAALMLDGMRCAACVWLIERQLSRIHGVLAVSINYTTQRAVVRWNERIVRLSTILAAVADIGYRAVPFDVGTRERLTRRERKTGLARIFVAGIGMMQVMMYAVPVYLADGDMTADIEQLMRIASLLLTIPVVLFSAHSIFIGAWRELKFRRLGMDTPVALGIGAAFIASLIATIVGHGVVYFDSITMFVFLVLSARYLESQGRRRAATQLESAFSRLPASAIRLPDYPNSNVEEHISAVSLRVGDYVMVRPGDTVAADGMVVEGSSEVNESLLSGESSPIAKQVDATLIAGAINVGSPLLMRVEQVGQGTMLSALALMADRAVGERPRIARVADRAANHFVLALLTLAVLVGSIWLWLAPERALATVVSLLVVSCPCALSLAAPAALTTSTGRLLREGLLVTHADAIEALARATHFVFDKTGTLTEGKMCLMNTTPLGDLRSERCLAFAQALQHGSEHPIGRAICAEQVGSPSSLSATRITNFPGRGIEGEVDGEIQRIGTAEFVADLTAQPIPFRGAANIATTNVMLGSKRGWLARFDLHDIPRRDAKLVVEALETMAKEVILLSGDAPGPVREIASCLGIREAHANMTPQRKLDYVRALQDKGAVVAMIGDGINDAPVLSGADVSFAMGSGTDLAKIHADIVFLGSGLLPLHRGLLTARHALRIIKQNLLWAFAYNFTAIPLAAIGLINPWMAALGMSTSSILVVLNALRLNRGSTSKVSISSPKLALKEA
jgi:P-type Cu2+ transporter